MIVAFAYAGLVQSDGLTLSIFFGAASFIVGMAGGIIWIVSGLRLRPFDEVARHRTNSPKLRHVLSAQTSARLPPLRERAPALAPAQVDKSLLTIADPKWLQTGHIRNSLARTRRIFANVHQNNHKTI